MSTLEASSVMSELGVLLLQQVLPQQEVLPPLLLLPQLRRRRWKPRRKSLRSLTMTWALVFLTNPLCSLFNKKLDSAAVLFDSLGVCCAKVILLLMHPL
jgi:hypothetical protein